MRAHLKSKHLTEHAIVDQHQKQQQAKEVPLKKSCPNESDTTVTTEHKKLKQGKFQFQASGSNWGTDVNQKQQLITAKIAEMICRDMQPYSLVEDAGFRALLKAAEPRYVMPSRKTFSTEIVPGLYSQKVAEVKLDVSSAISLAFTTDGWTSRANNSYLSYTAHFLTQDFEPRNYCLNVENVDESHTAHNLAISMSKCISAWTTDEQQKSNMKLYVVADNAANIQAALNKLPHCNALSCFAHTLQLAINSAISDCTDLQTTISKAKSITAHFKHSVQSTQKLLALEKQMGLPELKLKQQCPTRWNSTYDMLQRLVSVKDAVSAVVASSKKLPALTALEWELAEAYASICKPFTVATAALSASKYPSISMVIPTLNQLKHTLQLESETSSCLQILKENLVDNIGRRWPNYEYNVTYAIATSLDPRYKDCGFDDADAAMQGKSMVLKEMVTQLQQQSRRSSATLLTTQVTQQADVSLENSSAGTSFLLTL